MNSVFTVYCCGTAYDHANGDLIAKLYDNTAGELSVDKAIMAGPGSSAISSYYYDPIPVVKQEESSFLWSLGSSLLNTTASMVAWAPYQLSTKVSLATGHQMSCNVGHLTAALEREQTLPKIINMIGWSRGAVTCHMMANALFATYGDRIQVNIFAIDPVPGASNFGEDEVTLPSNVASYVAILMLNENRSIMTAADLKVGKNTKYETYLFPGVHSTPVDGGPQAFCAGVYEVVRHMAEEFLAVRGTSFKVRKPLDPRLVCKHFASMLLSWDEFAKLGSSSRLTGSKTGYGNLRSRLSYGHYFVNKYHKLMFSKAYPELYERLRDVLSGSRESSASTSSSSQMVQRGNKLGQLLAEADKQTRASLEVFDDLRESASVIVVSKPRPMNFLVGTMNTSLLQKQVTKDKSD